MKTPSIKLVAAPFLGIALVLMAGTHQAHATVQTFTVSQPAQKTDISHYFDLTKFDTNLGTLTKVEISLSSNLDTILTVKNSASDTSTGNVKTHIVLGLSDPNALFQLIANKSFPAAGLQQTGYVYNLAGGTPTNPTTIVSPTLTSAVSSSQTFTTSNILNEFSANGAGIIPLYFETFTETLLVNTGGNTSATQVTNADATVVVSYTYDPMVNAPEPSSAAALLGMVGMGAIVRGLRRRTAL